ncbi:MotA/TolQ/ExbB proton channel family protein [Massilia violaceinigra]|uniref:Biopolymer transport protein ExbB n=1 Tax=Massilia violaceinigra TaxID=2045208 RepID=A0ABY4AC22_9BURK|nr:MotA/TolQ/ExbB proton channel family protein [Massilia violaceinigra]UOD31725.1 MotA/TolQ/ExbB proton channel family protein [Massilia violaceinigra]
MPPDNHFSVARYWEQGDAISHAVAWVLMLMSLVSWFFILSKAFSSWRVRRAAPALDAFWGAPSLRDGIALLALADRERIYVSLPQQGLAHAGGAATLAGEMRRDEQIIRVLRQEITRSTHRIESGLTVLASIGATAPFVGLLGTVWGIYHALSNVSTAGIVQIDKIAGPVGEALIMTGFGLVVAIPAVLAYNGLNRLNRLTLAELDGFAHDLHAYFGK